MNKKGAIWVFSVLGIFALVVVYVILSSPKGDTIDSASKENDATMPGEESQSAEISMISESVDDLNEHPDWEDEDIDNDLMYNDPPPDPNQGPPEFNPYPVEETQPELLLALSEVKVNGEVMDSYTFEDPVDFGLGHTYSQIEGITTFRGNNFRDNATYGRANVQDAKLNEIWTARSGSLTTPEGTLWTGHGWTGQPLIVRWPAATRQVMNMFGWAKEK
jgi:hypothetical protein